eukprot:gene17227-18948_t
MLLHEARNKQASKKNIQPVNDPVIELDYFGQLYYKKSGITTGKAYIVLFSCNLTRAAWLELLPDQSLERFLTILKRFIARRGRPKKIYSDNVSTFLAATKWVKGAEEQANPRLPGGRRYQAAI